MNSIPIPILRPLEHEIYEKDNPIRIHHNFVPSLLVNWQDRNIATLFPCKAILEGQLPVGTGKRKWLGFGKIKLPSAQGLLLTNVYLRLDKPSKLCLKYNREPLIQWPEAKEFNFSSLYVSKQSCIALENLDSAWTLEASEIHWDQLIGDHQPQMICIRLPLDAQRTCAWFLMGTLSYQSNPFQGMQVRVFPRTDHACDLECTACSYTIGQTLTCYYWTH